MLTKSTARTFVLMVLASLGAFSTINSVSGKNPSARVPDGVLVTHGTVSGLKPSVVDPKAAVERLYKLYYAKEKAASEAFDKKDNPSAVPFVALAKDFAELDQATRDAEQLQLMGEPAGSDLAARMRMLQTELHKLIWSARGAPQWGAHRNKVMQKLKRAKPRNDAFLQRQDQAIQAGQLESAEKELEKFAMQLAPDVEFLSPSEREPYNKYFLRLMDTMKQRLNAKRKPLYQGQAAQVLQEQNKAVQGFDDEMSRIVAELQTTGRAKIGENAEATHLDALDHLDLMWGNTSAALLRSWGIQWTYSGRQPTIPTDQLRASVDRYLTQIIQAATKLPGDRVRTMYPEVLVRVASMDRQAIGKSLAEVAESALGQLAAADASLPAQISAYEKSTSEIMRWKKKYATQQAMRIKRAYTQVGGLLESKAKMPDHQRASIFRAPPAGDRTVVSKVLTGNCSWQAFESGKYLMGKRVYDTESIRVSPKSRTAVIQFKGYHYSSVAVGMMIDQHVASLRDALLLNDEYQVLTIAAAEAISSAEQREYVAVGGEVRNVHVEPMVSRFVALPDAASMIATRTVPPGYDENIRPIDHACWRIDVSPHWVHHSHFVFEIPSKTTASAQ